MRPHIGQQLVDTSASIGGVTKLRAAACVPVEKIPHGRKSRYDGTLQSKEQPPRAACSPGNRRGSARQPARNSVQRRESGPSRIGSCRHVLLGYRGARMRDVSTHHVLVTEPSRVDWGDNRRQSGPPVGSPRFCAIRGLCEE